MHVAYRAGRWSATHWKTATLGGRAFVATGLPALLAFSAVLGSGGLAAVASHLIDAADATSSVMLLIGMAVGVDYSLFYLKREREERRAGPPTR